MASFGGDSNGDDLTATQSDINPTLSPASFGQINAEIARIDPRVFGGMGVPAAGQKEEFLFNHGNTVSSRHWGEKLTYSLGVSYLAGAVLGSGWGMVEGVRAGAGLPMKLKVNRILNHTGYRGGKAANALGALTLVYCGVETVIQNARNYDDAFNHVGAGAGAGLIFKSTAGGRTAVVAAGIGAAMAAGIQAFQEYGPELPF